MSRLPNVTWSLGWLSLSTPVICPNMLAKFVPSKPKSNFLAIEVGKDLLNDRVRRGFSTKRKAETEDAVTGPFFVQWVVCVPQ